MFPFIICGKGCFTSGTVRLAAGKYKLEGDSSDLKVIVKSPLFCVETAASLPQELFLEEDGEVFIEVLEAPLDKHYSIWASQAPP